MRQVKTYGARPAEADTFLEDLTPGASEKATSASKIGVAADTGEAADAASERQNGKKRQVEDVRSFNTTGRIHQFASRIDDETDRRIRRFCASQKQKRGMRDKYQYCHFLEEAIVLMEAKYGK